MKKLLIALFALVAFNGLLNAQNSLSFRTGLNIGLATLDNVDDDISPLYRFQIGATNDFTITSNFTLQTGLLFNIRGASIEHDDHHDDFSINTLDIPLNLFYRNSNGFFIGVGPSIGLGLAAKFHTEDPATGEHVDIKIDFGSEPGELRRFNLAANIMAGYELENGFGFYVNYLQDLTDWSNIDGATNHFNVLTFGVSYRLGGRFY
jgi:long-subunit fatty acid transport protein